MPTFFRFIRIGTISSETPMWGLGRLSRSVGDSRYSKVITNQRPNSLFLSSLRRPAARQAIRGPLSAEAGLSHSFLPQSPTSCDGCRLKEFRVC